MFIQIYNLIFNLSALYVFLKPASAIVGYISASNGFLMSMKYEASVTGVRNIVLQAL